MKGTFCIVAVLCFAVAAQQQTQKKSVPHLIRTPASFYSAEDFINMTEADRTRYASGLMDGFFASAFFGATDQAVESLSSCTKGMDAKQVSAIITKYVKDDPQSWHLPLSIEALNALNAVCPGELKTLK